MELQEKLQKAQQLEIPPNLPGESFTDAEKEAILSNPKLELQHRGCEFVTVSPDARPVSERGGGTLTIYVHQQVKTAAFGRIKTATKLGRLSMAASMPFESRNQEYCKRRGGNSDIYPIWIHLFDGNNSQEKQRIIEFLIDLFQDMQQPQHVNLNLSKMGFRRSRSTDNLRAELGEIDLSVTHEQ